MDEKALDIVMDYIIEHLDKSDTISDFETYMVWKCKVWILAKDVYTCGVALKNVLYWLPIPKLPEQECKNE